VALLHEDLNRRPDELTPPVGSGSWRPFHRVQDRDTNGFTADIHRPAKCPPTERGMAGLILDEGLQDFADSRIRLSLQLRSQRPHAGTAPSPLPLDFRERHGDLALVVQ
jgi:hypothetical protein